MSDKEDTKVSVLSRFSQALVTPSPDPLDQLLDLDPLDRQVTVVTPSGDGQEYVTVREGIHRVLGKVETAMDDLLGIARQSQHPRAFEVVNQLAKTLLEGYDELLDTKKKAQELNEAPNRSIGGDTHITHNTLVVTPNEMWDKIKTLIKS